MSVTPITTNKPNTGNPEEIQAWEAAVADAEKAGIYWQRPEGDARSAEDIINSNLLLKDLENIGNDDAGGVRDLLLEQAGDFEHDADAAYRAVQVLNHVEQFDANGNRLSGNDIGNGSIEGFTSSDDAKNGIRQITGKPSTLTPIHSPMLVCPHPESPPPFHRSP
jgi:hypothetical protein